MKGIDREGVVDKNTADGSLFLSETRLMFSSSVFTVFSRPGGEKEKEKENWRRKCWEREQTKTSWRVSPGDRSERDTSFPFVCLCHLCSFPHDAQLEEGVPPESHCDSSGRITGLTVELPSTSKTASSFMSFLVHLLQSSLLLEKSARNTKYDTSVSLSSLS